MTTVYTTEDLIKILAEEYQACITGQRLNLAVIASGVNPLIDQFVSTQGLQKFTAYQDFRAIVHRYQRAHQVSGIVWRQLTAQDQTLQFPTVDEQLIALASDLETLRSYKDAVFTFWQKVTAGMDLYLADNRGINYQPITEAEVAQIAQRVEWASLSQYKHGELLEMTLQLGWGEPREARYQRGWPESGSEFICAVSPGERPVCQL